MKKISKYKVDISLIITIILFSVISIISISSAQKLITTESNLVLKQLFWIIFGIGIIIIIMTLKNEFIYRHATLLYIIGVASLVLLLIFGKPINNSKCWFVIPKIGSIQPSEFMKIFLILELGKVINDFNEKFANPNLIDEFKLIIKCFVIFLIPSVLTFLQPDTGVVIIYFAITITMLFISGIKYRWFFIGGSTIALVIGIILGIFFLNQDLFIDLFGSSLFYRIERITDWSSGTGMQLTNALAATGSAGLFGFGYGNTPVYFPEPQTDFIFSVYASNFGLIGSIFLIFIIIFFITKLVNLSNKNISNIDKYILSGIIGMLIYQYIQNIGMNIGLLPITGITLPFISYGGSSLISYMIILGIIFNISNETIRYKN